MRRRRGGRRYSKPDRSRRSPLAKGGTVVTGTLQVHPSGYGFVVPEDPVPGGDVFIPRGRLGHALQGDRVSVQLLPAKANQGKKYRSYSSTERRAGKILEVVQHSDQAILGRVFRFRNEVLAAPLDTRFHSTVRILDADAWKLEEGQVVAVQLQEVSPVPGSPLGKVVEVLGRHDDPDIQIRIVCFQQEIPLAYSGEALDQARCALPLDESELRARRDFRDQWIVTIDGETARDFDDAVGLEKLEHGGFRLGVHIADVSHYVTPYSPLDREARRRGTSVYFPDRAVPMLPVELSSELCSLKPQEDRPAISVVIELDGNGIPIGRETFLSVIRSQARLTYTEVQEVLEGRPSEAASRYGHLVHMLHWMEELSLILRERRRERGAIDLDLPEPEIIFDDKGEVQDVVRAPRYPSHRIIEEFMLLANETVAEHLVDREVPLIYRVHEDPDPEKVEEFEGIAAQFGYSLVRSSSRSHSPKDFQRLTDRLSGQPEAPFLSYLMLRSFKQARYSDVNSGHFGLAAVDYTHFTSPIRRYPDLVVHQILRSLLQESSSTDGVQQVIEELEEIAEHSSRRERMAAEAERQIARWHMAKFMARRLGDEFGAVIMGVRHNGFFVELEEHFVEGFVPVETLRDDFYVLDPRHYCLIGQDSRRVFRLGQRVRVQVDKVNVERRLIDFSVVSAEPPEPRKRRR